MSMADRVAVLNAGRLEQVDTPVALYAAPCTRFVADFIGTANLLDGTAVAGGIALETGLVLPADHTLPAGTAATAVVRPEDVTLAPAGAGTLEGTVVDTFFLGGTSTVSVQVPGLASPFTCNVRAVQVPQRGSQVGLVIDAARTVAVEDDHAASPRGAAQETVSP